MNTTRRQFLASAAAGSLLLPSCVRRAGKPVPGSLVGPSAETGHRLRVGQFPPPAREEKHAVVIVGGGVAGLAAARKLQQLGCGDFLLLELEPEPGGNSRSGENSVSPYPWGAHYVTLPGEDATEVLELYEELGLITGKNADGLPVYEESALVADPSERLFLNGRWQEDLLPTSGATGLDRGEFERFHTLITHFKAARGNDGARAFTIPVDRSSTDPRFTALDQITARQWLHSENLHSERLHWYLDYVCRDDFGGTIDQVSAWAAVHYFASRNGRAANADPDVVLTWPNGNGWLIGQLREPVAAKIRTRHLAWSVAPNSEGKVQIDAFDFESNQSVRFQANTAIVCTPWFVTRKIVQPLSRNPDFPLEYGPWVSANLTLRELPAGAGFGPAWDNVFYNSRSLGYVVATHQSLAQPKGPTVITWYAALCDGPAAAEREKAAARSHAQWCEIILEDLRRVHPEIDALVRNIDVCVWGHGMIRPVPGVLCHPGRKQMAQPAGAIHFAHSDLSGFSVFEEAYTRGVQAAKAAAHPLAPFSA